mgnify:CR=1 FL=1
MQIPVIELLPFRKLCTEKYEKLGIPFPLASTPECSEEVIRELRTYVQLWREYGRFLKESPVCLRQTRKNFSDIDTARASMSENILVIFPSEKLHPHFNKSVHLLPILQNLLQLHRTSRKCEAWASIFVEMFAQASFFTTQNSLVLFERIFCEPFQIYHDLSFCFLWRHLCRYTSLAFFFRERKRERK